MTTIISDRVRNFCLENTKAVETVSQYVEGVVTGYIGALLWSESCNGTAPESVCDHFGKVGDERGDCDKSLSHDLNYNECDLSGEAYESIRADVEDFTLAQWDELNHNSYRINAEQAGHDFLLTRNGHGAGFWDRGLGERGNRLTEACKPYGETSAYVGDDELIYVS